MRKVLPLIISLLTGSPRYLPEIEWSSNSWTHNLFRVYELIFWRRKGLRVESYADSTGQYAMTLEASLAILEGQIRSWLKRFKIVPLKVSVPILAPANGFHSRTVDFPYLFAIAVDATGTGGAGGNPSDTWAHTVSGTERGLIVLNGSRDFYAGSSVTYNGDAMTFVIGGTTTDNTGDINTIFKLIAPDTGTNNVVATEGGADTIGGCSISFTGADQVTLTGATGKNLTNPGSSTSYSLTTTRANSYTVESQLCQATGAITQDQSQTEIEDIAVAATRQRAGAYKAHTTVGSKTLGWSTGASNAKWSAFAEVMEVGAPVVSSVSGTGLLSLLGVGN